MIAIVKLTNAPVHILPDERAAVITKLPRHTEVQILNELTLWYEISSIHIIGFVQKKHIRKNG